MFLENLRFIDLINNDGIKEVKRIEYGDVYGVNMPVNITDKDGNQYNPFNVELIEYTGLLDIESYPIYSYDIVKVCVSTEGELIHNLAMLVPNELSAGYKLQYLDIDFEEDQSECAEYFGTGAEYGPDDVWVEKLYNVWDNGVSIERIIGAMHHEHKASPSSVFEILDKYITLG